MFEKLYKQPITLARHQTRPLTEERTAFLRQLEDEGMTRANLLIAATYLLIIADRLGLASRHSEAIGLSESEKEAARWTTRRTGRFRKGKRSDRARQRFTCFATRWLGFLERLERPEALTTPFDKWIDAFAEHMRQERGLAEKTIHGHCKNTRDFLCGLDVAPDDFAGVTIAQIQEALTTNFEEAGWARSTMQSYISALRGFFRLAVRMGWAPRGIAESLESPRIYIDERIPTGVSWGDVQRLIATTERERPIDIRDRALLLVLAVYGFRAGEVASLTLDSINWSSAIFSVRRGKNKKTQTFPLCRTVGDAILRYLREVRPTTPHRGLFFRFDRPLPLKSSGVTIIVQRRLRAANISLSRPGAHALRHACASRLLAQGLSMKEIGDHLGHQSLDSTRIYAKVDLIQLRRVADLDLGGVV